MAAVTKLASIVVGLLVVLFVSGFMLPSAVHVERSTIIQAPPEDIFPVISDFSQWQQWSPWAQKDPNMSLTVEGTGIGQTMSWQSDSPDVGSGTQTITSIAQDQRVQSHLDFGDNGISDATFTLTPQAAGTLISWSLDMDTRQGVPLLMQPISTYFGFALDNLVGKDYEAGLENLKNLFEQ